MMLLITENTTGMPQLKINVFFVEIMSDVTEICCEDTYKYDFWLSFVMAVMKFRIYSNVKHINLFCSYQYSSTIDIYNFTP
jgi:hypothetical protein